VKHQNKMLVIILGIGILAVGIIAGLAIKRKQRK
jgi:LPXTG-motif cell wall-anchored protein